MPLYLVRWPWLTASLVSARDEDDLLDTLDQVADTEGATWTVYRGPLWVDFEVPAEYRIEEKTAGEPLRPDEIVVDDVSKVEVGEFELSRPECDHTSERPLAGRETTGGAVTRKPPGGGVCKLLLGSSRTSRGRPSSLWRPGPNLTPSGDGLGRSPTPEVAGRHVPGMFPGRADQ